MTLREEIERAVRFYASSPDGQYDHLAFRALVRWLHQLEQRKQKR